MKKFNIDKILLCFGIFFVSIFGVGLIDSHAYNEKSSKQELDSLMSSYPYYFIYSYSQRDSYNKKTFTYTYYVFLNSKDVYFSKLDYGRLVDKDSNELNYGTDYTTFYTVHRVPFDTSLAAEDDYYKNAGIFSTTYQTGSGTYQATEQITSSNLDLKLLNGTVVFQNNPLKEVKQVGEAVMKQAAVILPIGIFLMGCLILVQISRRVLARFSIG